MLVEEAGAESKRVIEQVLNTTANVELTQFFSENASVLHSIGAVVVEVDHTRRIVEALEHSRDDPYVGVIPTHNGRSTLLVVNRRGRNQQFVDIRREGEAVVIVY